jgi:hypothetical protein
MRHRPRLGIVGLALALLVGLLPVLAPTADASAKASKATPRIHQFPDVPESSIFHDVFTWMADEYYMTGYSDCWFHPLSPTSRQAVVQILWRMSGSPAGPFPPEPFTDVAPGHAFYTAISWAYSEGIIGGFSDGTFRGTRSMSRQALGAILHDLSGIEKFYAEAEFSDLTATNPFKEDIWWWVSSGQGRGYSDGTFRPTEPVSRQAAASFLSAFYDMMGGFWPHVDHHEHVCDIEPTPAENEAADALLAAALVQVPLLFETKGEALAAGYRVTAPPFGGEGSHMVNDDYTSDGIALDPTKPESLVVGDDPGPEDNNSPIAAEMFVREYVGTGPYWPPEPGGCRTPWHGHDNLCYDGSLLEESQVVWLADLGGCPAGSMVRITPEMLHVWVDGRADPFEGIET